MQTVDAFIE